MRWRNSPAVFGRSAPGLEQAHGFEHEQVAGPGPGLGQPGQVLEVPAQDVAVPAVGRGGQEGLELAAHGQGEIALLAVQVQGRAAGQEAQAQALAFLPEPRDALQGGAQTPARADLVRDLAHLAAALGQGPGQGVLEQGVRGQAAGQVEHGFAARRPDREAQGLESAGQVRAAGHDAEAARGFPGQGGQSRCALVRGAEGFARRGPALGLVHVAHRPAARGREGGELRAQGRQGAGAVAVGSEQGQEVVLGHGGGGPRAAPRIMPQGRERAQGGTP